MYHSQIISHLFVVQIIESHFHILHAQLNLFLFTNIWFLTEFPHLVADVVPITIHVISDIKE
jgi:hypothetical protein